jgi:hypothetical protein
MRKAAIIALLFYLSFFSCTKRLCSCDPIPPPSIKAVVIEANNIDCNRPLIKIESSDTAQVSNTTKVYTDTYIASQLPADLKTPGQKLFISISVFVVGEEFACTTMGPSYARLKVTAATSRN